ncbi:putative FAD-dependent oxygenase [Coniochaeta sp. 2T2.1]|nr:putative FAD-dependent oxygenase [Coniochaeta sp. 2T2.1]
MRWSKTHSLLAVAGWCLTATCDDDLQAQKSFLSPDGFPDIAAMREMPDLDELLPKLSDTARVYYPGTDDFKAASARWSANPKPRVNAVVVPGTEEDVAETVRFANSLDIPFLAYGGAHGTLSTLSNMDWGIAIQLSQLSSVEIAADGKTATIGGGTLMKTVQDILWDAGKQTVTGACECVSYVGPALGGGHGWLQGHHGLASDQFESLNVVLADGTLTTVSPESNYLWWAMRGAGHNFGIVTSVTSKIHPLTHPDWALETFMFAGDKIEDLYTLANEHLLQYGNQPADLVSFSFWMHVPAVDPVNPVLAFSIMQEGVTTVSSTYTSPFHALSPLAVDIKSGTYRDIASWFHINADSPVCLKNTGLAGLRFPLYLERHNVTAQRALYTAFADGTRGEDNPFHDSVFIFEGYSFLGVKGRESGDSSAFAYREGNNMLVSPNVQYTVTTPERDEQAREFGERLRDIMWQGSGRRKKRVYVNYAYGDEGVEELYGDEEWRGERLRGLKRRYDPRGRFNYYAPILTE